MGFFLVYYMSHLHAILILFYFINLFYFIYSKILIHTHIQAFFLKYFLYIVEFS